jgi:hypothetical protein
VCRGWEVVNCKMKVRVQELLEGIQCSSVAHFEFGGLLWTVLELRLEFSAVFFFIYPLRFPATTCKLPSWTRTDGPDQSGLACSTVKSEPSLVVNKSIVKVKLCSPNLVTGC